MLEKKTASEFNGRVYERKAMVMVVRNAPQMIQRVVTRVLNDCMSDVVNVYMVSVIIMGRIRIDHNKILGKV